MSGCFQSPDISPSPQFGLVKSKTGPLTSYITFSLLYFTSKLKFITIKSPSSIWRSLSCPCDSCQNPAESSRIIFGRESCQNCHSGDHLFQWNRAIPEMGPEWTRTESGGMLLALMINQCTPHLGCFHPIGVSTGH